MSKTLLYIIGGIVAIFVLETFSKQSSASTLGIPNTLLASNPAAQNFAVGVAAGTTVLGDLSKLFNPSPSSNTGSGVSLGDSSLSLIPAGFDPTLDYLN